MADRQPDECKFFLKENKSSDAKEEIIDGEKVRKVKKVIQKKDENGNPIFEVKEVKVRQGCRCKGKNRKEKIIKKRVPVTEEIWIEKKVPNVKTVVKENKNNDGIIICKLYGKIKRDFCQTCSTFKKKK